jgi:hypothetical protein
MEKLETLIEKCKCGVHITVNAHRDYYETVEQHFKSNPITEEDLEDIEPDVYDKMKELNTIIELQYYPDTPIGFYKVYHYDIEKAIDEALSSLNGG